MVSFLLDTNYVVHIVRTCALRGKETVFRDVAISLVLDSYYGDLVTNSHGKIINILL